MQKQAIDSFIQNGGKIEHCPPCETFQYDKPKSRVWHAPKNGHDKEICAECKNKGRCEDPCSPLEWIDGNVPRRENFINERMLQFAQPDYKTIIYDLAQHHDPPDRQEEITAIKGIRVRAICAMMAVKISKQEITELLSITRMQLHRIIKKCYIKKARSINDNTGISKNHVTNAPIIKGKEVFPVPPASPIGGLTLSPGCKRRMNQHNKPARRSQKRKRPTRGKGKTTSGAGSKPTDKPEQAEPQ